MGTILSQEQAPVHAALQVRAALMVLSIQTLQTVNKDTTVALASLHALPVMQVSRKISV